MGPSYGLEKKIVPSGRKRQTELIFAQKRKKRKGVKVSSAREK